VTAGGVPAKPRLISVVPDGNVVHVSFDPPAIATPAVTQYWLIASKTPGCTLETFDRCEDAHKSLLSGTSKTFRVSATALVSGEWLDRDTKYYFSVAARNSVGWGAAEVTEASRVGDYAAELATVATAVDVLNGVHVSFSVLNYPQTPTTKVTIRALDQTAGVFPFQIRFFGSCGDDDYAREFHQLLSERPWCHYGGMIGRNELRAEFARAELLVLPTKEDNCPMVVLEAQASGVPVIASGVGGIPDLIVDRVTGLLVDPSAPSSFRQAVESLLKNPELRKQLAKNAYQSALKCFHPKVVAAVHADIYREFLFKEKENRF
jgi:glycosyltransferase involved in cell wall biosynthesis